MATVAGLEAAGRMPGGAIEVFTTEAVPMLNRCREQIMVIPEGGGPAGHVVAQAAIQAIRAPDKPPMQGLETPTDGET